MTPPVALPSPGSCCAGCSVAAGGWGRARAPQHPCRAHGGEARCRGPVGAALGKMSFVPLLPLVPAAPACHSLDPQVAREPPPPCGDDFHLTGRCPGAQAAVVPTVWHQPGGFRPVGQGGFCCCEGAPSPWPLPRGGHRVTVAARLAAMQERDAGDSSPGALPSPQLSGCQQTPASGCLPPSRGPGCPRGTWWPLLRLPHHTPVPPDGATWDTLHCWGPSARAPCRPGCAHGGLGAGSSRSGWAGLPHTAPGGRWQGPEAPTQVRPSGEAGCVQPAAGPAGGAASALGQEAAAGLWAPPAAALQRGPRRPHVATGSLPSPTPSFINERLEALPAVPTHGLQRPGVSYLCCPGPAPPPPGASVVPRRRASGDARPWNAVTS